nr:TrmH family RNA methyltransferase [Myceligenerans indicum]
MDDGAGPRPDPRYDPELLAEGDRRNVTDRYRYWRVEAIVADMDARRPPDRRLHVAIENWSHDLNIGSVVRTANAFNAAGVHVVGRRRWNRRGAMVTDRYLHVHHHPDAEALAAWAAAPGGDDGRRLPVVGIDNIPGSVPIEGYVLPPRCVLLFGQESTGLTPEAQAVCDVVLHITQYGSTRSVNAGAAAAIAMHAWAARHL